MTTALAFGRSQPNRFWARLGTNFLPFADAASPTLPIARLLRLSLFQITVGMAAVMLIGTLNRVMIIELHTPSWLVALMVSLPLVFAPLRALIGHKSDNHRSILGWKRVPYIWFGTLLQFGGFAIMPFALLVLTGVTYLVATQDFTARRQAVETQTGWNSFQLRRRIRRVFKLPAVPTNADLAMVARKLLPHATDAMVHYIVGYALTSKGYMQAVVDAIDDARLLAQEAGRERITSADLKRSIEDFRAPSDAAQKRVFAPTAKRGRKHAFTIAADDEPQPGNTTAADLPPSRGRAAANEFPSDESTTTNRLRGHELAET